MAAGRGRKTAVVLLVLLVVLGGLLLVADRIAAYAAERTVARQAKQQLTAQQIDSPADPRVTVAGFPFLTQVARGRYEKITIDVTRPSAQGVTLDDLLVVATGINASTGALLNGSGQITADNVTGTVRMGWDSATKLIDLSPYGGSGATVSATADGQVRITAPISIANVSTTAVATGSISIVGDDAKVHITKVTAADGSVPPIIRQVLGSLTAALSFTVPIPPLPYHLKVKSVQAQPEGVTVTAVATGVPISGQGA